MMKTIAFINNKGGVGKTASVTTVGHMLSTLHNKRVLLIDLDPQGNTTGMFLDVDLTKIFKSIIQDNEKKKEKEKEKEISIEDVLINPDMDIHKAIRKTVYEGLDIIPAFLTLAECEELLKADITTPQQFKLKMALAKVANEYDYCLIDCSPSISILNVNGLTAADEVYIPLRSDGNSFIGLAITRNLVETVAKYNPVLEIAGAFITQYNPRMNVARGMFELLEKVLPQYEIPMLPISIPVTKLLQENTIEQKPLLDVDDGKNKSKATLAYMDLTEYIISPNKKEFIKEYANKEV